MKAGYFFRKNKWRENEQSEEEEVTGGVRLWQVC